MSMKIIAQQGKDSYLLEDGEDPAGRPMVRILSLDQRRLSMRRSRDSVLGRGYWTEYTGPQDVLQELLARVGIEPDC